MYSKRAQLGEWRCSTEINIKKGSGGRGRGPDTHRGSFQVGTMNGHDGGGPRGSEEESIGPDSR